MSLAELPAGLLPALAAIDLGIFGYEFMQRAIVAGVLVAILAGLLGVFLVLRQMSLLGDGLAHVSFAGIAVGLASGFYPIGMALLFSVVGAIAIYFLRERGIVKGDTAIGILLTSGLALGIVVVSASTGFVNTSAYLFGQILAIDDQDLRVVLGVGIGLVILLAAFYKEFVSMTYSEEAARVTGLPVDLLNVVFVSLTAATIVVTIRVVGVLLISALIVVPAATALQLARGFRRAIALSVLVAVASVVVGILIGAVTGWVVSGLIALVAAAFFLLAVIGRRIADHLRPPVGTTPPAH
ncbi:MAG: zinc transport system permease protein [Thermoplasmata archaeon]|jgi:zinc transport system permease protein|nr:zinc transport system permease protein [Thermoplasmata archaeon]MEA3165497.1 zinc transport system permease protein [Thermoplasmata archaeon]